MFHQALQPVGHSLFLSFVVGVLPILTVLVLLGILRLPAWQAALAGLVVGFVIAVAVWSMPVDLAARSVANGGAFALWPVMWIVWNAMWLYNIAVRSGKFDLFRRWMVHNVPPDRRILLLIVGFSFGALMEGIAGFGTPVAIGSALLVGLGFPALEAVTLTLIFDTAPVAFGALGVPITTLSTVTGLPAAPLSAMVGRQLPFFAFLLPFYAIVVLTGFRGLRTSWPVALVAGGSFALTQFTVSNFIGPELPDVLAALVSLIAVVAFVQVWKPSDIAEYAAAYDTQAPGRSPARTRTSPRAIGEQEVPVPDPATATRGGKPTPVESFLGWLPWLMVSAVVIIWTRAKVALHGEQDIAWPGLNNHVFLTLYGKPYKAIYIFQPLGTGTAILVAVLLTALLLRVGPGQLLSALVDTWEQLRFAILTVVLILGLAYLFNYSGIAYTVGLAISKVGGIFPFFSAFLGWIACFLSGSDTSSNALFGNLQVVAARQLKLNSILMAATNSSGAVMSKMISPQSVTTGVSTTELVGKEGLVIRRTFVHSVILATLLGLLALAQQYIVPGIIPK
ncbi:MAG: lactate permease LctP family transporter [Chloroflexota bacterium]